MISYNHLFEKLVSPENIRRAILNASKRKKDRTEVLWVLGAIDEHVEIIRNILINDLFKPQIHIMTIIYDKSSGKERRIIKPYFYRNQYGEPVYEQIIQHAVIQVLGPLIKKSSYEYSCGSMPGRGCHSGMKYLKTQIKRYKNTDELKYFLKGDFKHFYESVDVTILKDMLAKKIHDARFLKVLYTIIDSNKAYYGKELIQDGIPIGFYSSQWLANFFLSEMDHYIKEKFKVKIYVRYMDDFLLFGNNKRELHKILEWIKGFAKKRNLTLKKNYQISLFNYYHPKKKEYIGSDISFMGFRFFRYKIILRKTLIYRALSLAKRVEKAYNTGTLNWYLAAKMLSYMGWFKATDTYKFYVTEIAPRAHIKLCKHMVSKRFMKEFKKKAKRILREEYNLLRWLAGTKEIDEKNLSKLKRLAVLKEVLQIKTPIRHKKLLRRINI